MKSELSNDKKETDITFDENATTKEVLLYLAELAKHHEFVYRGYSKQEELLPGIIREGSKYNEKKLLTDLERYGGHYIHVISPIEFISCAQHFGLPTRLLDFTHNPFIALYFALYDKKETKYNFEEDKQYYYLRYANIKNNLTVRTIPIEKLFSFRELDLSSIAEKTIQTIDWVELMMSSSDKKLISDLEKVIVTDSTDEIIQNQLRDKVILFVDPNQSNERIIMQQGLFMLPYIIDEESHLNILNSNTSLIKIHKNLRDDLLEYLDGLGFNAFRLMPDLASICKYLKKRDMNN